MIVLLVGALWARIAWTGADIEREWQLTRGEKMQNLGTTRSLEILPLFEEATSRGDLELEHSVSYLVKTDHQNILLDVGMTPARLSHNMHALDVSEKDFDAVLITPIHPDHLGGTNAWWNNMLMAGDPPLDLRGKPVYVPLPMGNRDLNPTVVKKPAKLADDVATIGAIAFPDLFPLSLKSPRNAEQVLAVNVEGQGIVLIMGCGHPTIERIVARAQALFDQPIVGLVGGLHYEGMTREQTQPHLAFVSLLNPQLVAISPHDSSTAALQAFQEAFPGVFREVKVGQAITMGKLTHLHTQIASATSSAMSLRASVSSTPLAFAPSSNIVMQNGHADATVLACTSITSWIRN